MPVRSSSCTVCPLMIDKRTMHMSGINRSSRLSWRVTVLVGIVWFCVFQPWTSTPVSAQTDDVPVEELSAVIETLEDDAARQRFLKHLKTLLATHPGFEPEAAPPVEPVASPTLSVIAKKAATLGAQFGALAGLVGDPRKTGRWIIDQAQDFERRRIWVDLLLHLAIVVLAGALVGWFVHKVLARPRLAVEQREASSLGVRATSLAARTVLDFLTVAAFAVAAYLTVAAADPNPATRIAIVAIVNAVAISRGIVVVLRMSFAPLVPSLRLIDISDQTAVYAYLWLKRLVNVPVFGFFLLQAALALGLPPAGYAGLLKLVGLLETILVIVLVLQMREAVANAMSPDQTSRSPTTRAWDGLRGRIAEVWHILCALYIAGVYLIWALEVPGGFVFVARATAVTVVILIVARLVNGVAHRGVRRLFRVSGDIRQRYPQVEQRANRYVPLISRLFTVAIYTAAAFLVLQAWHIDVFAWFLGESGQILVTRAFSIALVLLVGLAIWELVSLLISVYLERADAEDSSVTASARVRTLLPLARNALLIVIGSVVTLTVLSELGVDIGPLLAGAGVAGLAIGFGAQTLVKDVITGAFILFEDQIAVGDVVSVGGYTGVVQGLTVRTISLRDLHGRVHVVPFGAVTDVTNFTKEFSYAVIDAGIAYRENTDDVTQLLEEIGAELREDPDFADDLPEPLEVLGVQELADSAVVVRVRLKTSPGRQWAVSREFNRRMKRKFDDHGIEIPFPHQTIYFGEDKDAQAPPLGVSRHRGDYAKPSSGIVPEPSQRRAADVPDGSND